MNMHAVGFSFSLSKKAASIITVFLLAVFMAHSAHAQDTGTTGRAGSLAQTITGIIREPFPRGGIEKVTQEALLDSMLYTILASIKSPTAPFSYGKYFIFTHYDKSEDARASIAFADEQYAQTHHFVRLKSNPKILVYILPKKETATTLQYRLVINGVWTHDYQNPNSLIDENNVHVSTSTMSPLPRMFFPSFVYNSKKKQLRFFLYLDIENPQTLTDTSLQEVDATTIQHVPIYVVGNFSAWDPFLIRMQKSPEQENLYYADVTLDKGTYYYYFQVGNYDILDPRNRSIVPRRTEDLYVNTLIINNAIDAKTGAPYLIAKKPSN